MTPEERATDVLDDAANRIMQPDEHRPHRAISEAVRAAIADEREACAKIAESRVHVCVFEACCAEGLAAAIRARGEAPRG